MEQKTTSSNFEENKKTFLLGVGCQKGGTSWLHDYLAHMDQADMGFDKEYHVFDTVFYPYNKGHYHRLAGKKDKRSTEFMRFIKDFDTYFDYFKALVDNPKKDIKLTGDITPAYCALEPYVFKLIKNGLEQRGFNVKVVFLMRDPFERIWSSVRMFKRMKRSEFKDISDTELIMTHFREENQQIRTTYDKTIKNLEQVFNSENIYYQFYETLFNETAINEITDFLNIDYIKPDFGKRVNTTNKDTDNDLGAIKNMVVNYYRDTYYFMMDRFGDKIKDIWASTSHLY